MSVIDALNRAKTTEFSEEGDPLEVSFLDGISQVELDNLEQRLGAPLPDDFRTLAQACGGIDCPFEVDFGGGSTGQALEELLPKSLTIAQDGFGNSWEVDLLSTREAKACIFYACHDAPVLLYQCTGMEEFLDEVVASFTPPGGSKLNLVEDDAIFQVWSTNPGTITRDEALQSPDSAIRTFAQELDARFLIVDLRAAPCGMGLSWGRYGPDTDCRRFGEERLFAYGPPEGEQVQAKKSFWKRIFG